MYNNKPILITAADRSGSSIVAKIFSMCGAFGGYMNNMNENIEIKSILSFLVENNSITPYMPNKDIKPKYNNWGEIVQQLIRSEEGFKEEIPFMYKDSKIAQTWRMWNEVFPDAKWVIVRRRTGDVISSCIQTAYMKRFKDIHNLKAIGVNSEIEGWLWWVHQYEERFKEIIEATPNVRIIWPERMAENDFQQMKETVEWSGLKWNEEVEVKIPKLLRKGGN